MERLKVAVFASGRGSDFQSLIDARDKGELDVDLVLLVSNRPGAMCIERAKKAGIDTFVLDHHGMEREEWEERVEVELRKKGVNFIVLAGFMRLLSASFVSRWRNKIINIHPALLPSFPGVHAHRDALDYGVKVTGLTIHFVDEKMDHGPVIFQYPVWVKDDDTEESLSQRVLEQEHIWYPRVLQWIAEGRVEVQGRLVKVRGITDSERAPWQ
ncbi:MAG: phosphoribosylglycinamide formyltransferase [Thermoplasmata archaeon]|nr:phosphoribosylglycinamide formyltransferase [Thermoplasmata archaeon]RLF69430.1 MAG: phosphoribosylglycinamide formyltransferase [Thermoplasmata archaeon]RLF70907.1 MAG: phosphoribosylglycinamide formyltransferase [Thermoplasmata archaeon]